MMALHQSITNKSTIVRSKIGPYANEIGRRGGPRGTQRIWGGSLGRPNRTRADQRAGDRAATDADRLERWVAGLLTLIAAGYGIAVLVRIVALYA